MKIEMRPIDKVHLESELKTFHNYAVCVFPIDEHREMVGMMELLPVVRVEKHQQVIDVCLRSMFDDTILLPVVCACKSLDDADDWIQRLKYIVMRCVDEGKSQEPDVEG